MPTVIPPDVLAMITETNALNSALLIVDEGTGTVEEAQKLIQKAFETKSTPKSATDHIILTAMRHILGGPLEPIPIEGAYIAECVGLAWTDFLRGKDVRPALTLIKPLLDTSKSLGAMHVMALQFWIQAIEAGKTTEGRRLWKRALEVSSSFGVESHPMLQWAYVATWLEISRPQLSGEGP
jgi:hypothetical protein